MGRAAGARQAKVEELDAGLDDMLLRRARPNPPEAVARFAGYEGTYADPDGDRATLTRIGDSLFLEFAGWPRVERRFDGVDRFRIVEFDARCTAQRGPDGKVAALSAEMHGEQPQRSPDFSRRAAAGRGSPARSL